jgi:hypothetical protein
MELVGTSDSGVTGTSNTGIGVKGTASGQASETPRVQGIGRNIGIEGRAENIGVSGNATNVGVSGGADNVGVSGSGKNIGVSGWSRLGSGASFFGGLAPLRLEPSTAAGPPIAGEHYVRILRGRKRKFSSSFTYNAFPR